MTRRERVRGAFATLLCTVLLAGCTATETKADEPPAPVTPPPVLEAEWSIPGWLSNPQRVGAHHWMTYQSSTVGVGRATMFQQGPVLLVDARTGKARERVPDPERWPCEWPARISDSGVVPMMWATYAMGPLSSELLEECSRIIVMDATSGKTLWRTGNLDLDDFSDRRVITADDHAVAVVDVRGRILCFGARDGRGLPVDDASCLRLSEEARHADLPELVDADGAPVPLSFRPDGYSTPTTEIGRTDEVLLATTLNDDGETLIRAHDLTTGETLWQRDDLVTDPEPGSPWQREETYAVTPSGIVRVSYEHPEGRTGPEIHATPMVLTAVDPMTGEDIRPVARILGGLFAEQIGDKTVALTNQDRQLQSTISGFTLPTW